MWFKLSQRWAVRCGNCGFSFEVDPDERCGDCPCCDEVGVSGAFKVSRDWIEDKGYLNRTRNNILEKRRRQEEYNRHLEEEQWRRREAIARRRRLEQEERDKREREKEIREREREQFERRLPLHYFQLRKSCQICFRLPFDLNDYEAKRLRAFVMTIPVVTEYQDSCEPEIIDHSFRLRQDFVFCLSVPEDVTDAEAVRLGAFIESLPIL